MKRLAGRRSPNWAFMEKFVVPHYDDPTGPPYLIRWRILQTPLFGIFLHKLGTPDPRDTLHNHPFPFISFILLGGYTEFVQSEIPEMYAESRWVKWVNIKRMKDWHWISELDRTPTWTLMFVGRRRKVWQYLDRDGTKTDYDKHPFNDLFTESLKKHEQWDAA